ncbi:Protein NLRC5 [Holothuria leucospilota]|uniref:Protein NLRC5 n=1 Tax=Holothuria leucospilota TaxID=206669 RepID=A0A9Q1GZJ1_HOLLE|nr:Protein NLRC5 [Holothuria leucospilota]
MKNRETPSKVFVFTLEENGTIHPSNVSLLKDALASLEINPACYSKVLMYENSITEITLYDRFVSELSSYIGTSTASDLCDYFDFSKERKNNIIFSQNPGQSLLFALDERAVIKPTDTIALEYPLKHLPLIQALAKLHEYQSTIPGKYDNRSSLFLECLRKKLIHWYEAMTPVPWKKSCKWKSSDLFVGNGLILKDFQSTRTPLSIDKECKLQYTDIFSHKNLVSEKLIILEGDPGCGKTMLTTQLAYDWTQGKLQNVDILIWLPLKFVNDKTLIESIREFYIPESAPLLEDDMVQVLSSETKVIAVLLDGLEEYNYSIKEGDESEVAKVFNGKKHTNWKVVLTSRSDYAHDLPVCPRLEVGSFGNDERSLYIKKLCDGDLMKQNKIETTINDNPFILDLCSVPLLFVLAVHNIEAVDTIKDGNLERVGPFMKSMISTLIADKTLAGKIVGPGSEYSSSGPMHLGEVAFNGLCMGRQQLLWQRQFLESNIDNLRDWIDSGIMVIEGIHTTTTLNEDTEPRKDQAQILPKVTMLGEDGGDVPEQEVPQENFTYPAFNDNDKKADEQEIEPSHTLDTSHATRDEDSLFTGPTEENFLLSEMTTRETEQVTRNISRKHVPQALKFLHKVIQEWFAATYFSYMMRKCPNQLQYAKLIFEHLFLLDPTDLHYVLRFSCFLHPPFCHTILTHLLQNYRSKDDGKVPDYIQNCMFFCFAEHNGIKGTDIAKVVSDICKQEIVIDSQDSRLLQQAKATMLEYASNSKITIEKVFLRDVVKDVSEYGMILSSGARMAILDTLQTVEVSSWNLQLEGKHLQNIVEFLSRSQQIMEIV